MVVVSVCIYIHVERERGREERYGNWKMWCVRIDGPSVV